MMRKNSKMFKKLRYRKKNTCIIFVHPGVFLDVKQKLGKSNFASKGVSQVD